MKIVMGIVMFALVAAFTVPVATRNEVYLVPHQSTVTSCDTTVAVEIWANATGFQGGQINLTYDPTCANVTNWVRNTDNFLIGGRTHYDGRDWITFSTMDPQPLLLTGEYKIGTLTLQCVNESPEGCETALNFVWPSRLFNDLGSTITATWTDGVFRCKSAPQILDTEGLGDYPSISGTHNGTIVPAQDITVSNLYTYSCPGTGGHSEYVRIWNSSWNGTEAYWKGYKGDWHTISFDNAFTLYANKAYNYTIKTGSYPQIIHEQAFNALGGTIVCMHFDDDNGRRYYDWIPSIKLY